MATSGNGEDFFRNYWETAPEDDDFLEEDGNGPPRSIAKADQAVVERTTEPDFFTQLANGGGMETSQIANTGVKEAEKPIDAAIGTDPYPAAAPSPYVPQQQSGRAPTYQSPISPAIPAPNPFAQAWEQQHQAPAASPYMGYSAMSQPAVPTKPALTKAESYVSTNSAYSSPYDLPPMIAKAATRRNAPSPLAPTWVRQTSTPAPPPPMTSAPPTPYHLQQQHPPRSVSQNSMPLIGSPLQPPQGLNISGASGSAQPSPYLPSQRDAPRPAFASSHSHTLLRRDSSGPYAPQIHQSGASPLPQQNARHVSAPLHPSTPSGGIASPYLPPQQQQPQMSSVHPPTHSSQQNLHSQLSQPPHLHSQVLPTQPQHQQQHAPPTLSAPQYVYSPQQPPQLEQYPADPQSTEQRVTQQQQYPFPPQLNQTPQQYQSQTQVVHVSPPQQLSSNSISSSLHNVTQQMPPEQLLPLPPPPSRSPPTIQSLMEPSLQAPPSDVANFQDLISDDAHGSSMDVLLRASASPELWHAEDASKVGHEQTASIDSEQLYAPLSHAAEPLAQSQVSTPASSYVPRQILSQRSMSAFTPVDIITRPTSSSSQASRYAPPRVSSPVHGPQNPQNATLRPATPPYRDFLSHQVSPSAPSTVPPERPLSVPNAASWHKEQFLHGSQIQPDPRDASYLQRGYPVIRFGFGGTFLYVRPQRLHAAYMGADHVARPGLLHVVKLSSLLPIDKTLQTFPGPLLNASNKAASKTKKKELLIWLDNHIEPMQSNMVGHQSQPESQISIDRLILWKLVKIFVDNDGSFDKSDASLKSVRRVLLDLEEGDEPDNDLSHFTTSLDILSSQARISPVLSQGGLIGKTQFYKSMNDFLIRGEREKSVRKAMENGMWAHALLIASSVSKELWKDTVDEFVRSDMGAIPGTRPLQTLYQVFAGNGDSAITKFTSKKKVLLSPTTGVFEGPEPDYLQHWKQILCLIISNTKGADQVDALYALSSALAADGLQYAAHACLLLMNGVVGDAANPFSTLSILGESQDLRPAVSLDLTRHILLTEAVEFGFALNPLLQPLLPLHQLLPYKLQHSWLLAESSLNLEAQAYCEYMANVIGKNQKNSPSITPALIFHLKDLSQRLLDAPNSQSASGSSWLFGKMATKPKLDSFWSSMEGKFNKFVSGDDSLLHTESLSDLRSAKANFSDGPFNRIASGSSLSTLPQDLAMDNQAGRQSYTSNQTMDAQANMSFPIGSGSGSQPGQLYSPTGTSQMEPQVPPYNHVSQNPSKQLQAAIINQQFSMSPERYDGLGSVKPNTPQNYGLTSNGNYPYQPLNYESPSQLSGDQSTYQPPSYEPPMNTEDDDPNNSSNTITLKFTDENETAIHQLESNYYAPLTEAKVMAPASNVYTPRSPEESEEDETSSETSSEETNAKTDNKSWFSWLGRGKEKELSVPDPSKPGKPVKANLGEQSSFYYDPELKRWVNKNSGDSNVAAAPPPPPPTSINKQRQESPANLPVMLSKGATPSTQPVNLLAPSQSEKIGPSQPMSTIGGPPTSLIPPSIPSASSTRPSSTAPPAIAASLDDPINDLLSGLPVGKPRTVGRKNARSRYVDVNINAK